jgi:hypothetical protein
MIQQTDCPLKTTGASRSRGGLRVVSRGHILANRANLANATGEQHILDAVTTRARPDPDLSFQMFGCQRPNCILQKLWNLEVLRRSERLTSRGTDSALVGPSGRAHRPIPGTAVCKSRLLFPLALSLRMGSDSRPKLPRLLPCRASSGSCLTLSSAFPPALISPSLRPSVTCACSNIHLDASSKIAVLRDL